MYFTEPHEQAARRCLDNYKRFCNCFDEATNDTMRKSYKQQAALEWKLLKMYLEKASAN